VIPFIDIVYEKLRHCLLQKALGPTKGERVINFADPFEQGHTTVRCIVIQNLGFNKKLHSYLRNMGSNTPVTNHKGSQKDSRVSRRNLDVKEETNRPRKRPKMEQ
jgi:hypothetical protein